MIIRTEENRQYGGKFSFWEWSIGQYWGIPSTVDHHLHLAALSAGRNHLENDVHCRHINKESKCLGTSETTELIYHQTAPFFN